MASRGRTMLATWHFHIEISSKCTLKCPRCARQEVPDTLVNTELDLEFFKRNFTAEFITNHVDKITFCGDDGDPIYAHDLISVVRYIKSIKPVEIVIITNGSHKKEEWWAELGSVLTEQDSVHFSVDGYNDNSNNLYRINSDFNSIRMGVKTLRQHSDCYIVWAAIVFNFNQHQLYLIEHQAQELGCDLLQLTKSTKFGSVYPVYGPKDNLEPNQEWVSSTHRFEREYKKLTGKTRPVSFKNVQLYQKVQFQNNIVPLCEIGNKGLYIDARGRLFPCCWVANRYSHNNEWQTLAEKFNLHKRTLTDVVNDSFWTTDMKSYRWQECQTKCNQSVVTQEYATTW